jgi:hypothetical protein
MYCSSCGNPAAAGRTVCDACADEKERARLSPSPERQLEVFGAPRVAPGRVGVCARCGYQGEGLPHFSRGTHMFLLVAATFFTLPFAFGAGGFLYYGMRRRHRVCPRCGHGWGRLSEHPAPAPFANPSSPAPLQVHGMRRERTLRGSAVLVGAIAAIMVVVGGTALELTLIVLGVLAGVGALGLNLSANRARDHRRASIMANLQMQVLKLARDRDGRLTVTEVAASLSWPIRRAERVLNSLDDGWRVDSSVTDDGVIVYEFRELLLGGRKRPEAETPAPEPPDS